jgi:hypothetical protein
LINTIRNVNFSFALPGTVMIHWIGCGKGIYIVLIVRYKIRGKSMARKDVVQGLNIADVKEMADKIFSWTDGNHPHVNSAENGFLNILRNGKSEVSSSPAFIRPKEAVAAHA